MPEVTDPNILDALNKAQPGVIPGQQPPITPVQQSSMDDTSFDNQRALRSEFMDLPAVTSYSVALGTFNSALNTQRNAQGDQSLITSYAKMLDPESVVREGEFAVTSNTEPLRKKVEARLKKEFGWDGGGMLSDQGRMFIRQEMLNLIENRFKPAYDQSRTQYSRFAESYGFDPSLIVGIDPREPYNQAIVNFKSSLPQAGRTPDNAIGATPIESAYSPDQQKKIVSFWNANVGNTSLTPEAAAQWYQAMGIPEPEQAELMRGVEAARSGQTAFGDFPTMEAEEPNLHSRLASGYGDIVQGVGDVAGIVGNPLNQTINTAFGTNLSTDLGETLRTDISGIPHTSDPMVESINRAGAGAMTFAGAARYAGNVAGGIVGDVAQTVGRTPIRDTVSGMAAGAGGEAGEEYGGAPGRAAGMITGGLVGHSAASAVAPGASRTANPAMQAFERQGVDPLPAHVGGETTRRVTAAAKASPFSAQPVVSAARRAQDQLDEAAARTANAEGRATTTDVAGENIKQAGRNLIETSSARGERLYTRAFEEAGDAQIVPETTLAKLEERIARIKNDPAAPEGAAAELERFRDNIKDGVNILGLRDARTRLSQGVYDGKLRSNVERGMWKDILGDLSSDIEAGLLKADKAKAARMFSVADKYWSERVGMIDEVLEPILGKNKSGEQVVEAIESMARGKTGGNARLSRLLASMPDEQAGDIRALVINRMGRATAGQQDETGEAFSASTFLTNWNRLTPQGKASLFSDSELRQNLNDIATIASKMREAGRLENYSNTAGSVLSNVGLNVGAYAVDPVLFVLSALSQYGAGRLLASPRFARILARSAKLPSDKQQRYLSEQLGIIAARDPTLAQDIRGLQSALNNNFAHSTAASEQQKQ